MNLRTLVNLRTFIAASAASLMTPAYSAPVVYAGAGTNASAITAARDLFRVDVGGGTIAGANGLFGA